MAVVILGGLVTSTLLNLFVVPALYLRSARARRDGARDTGPTPAPRRPIPGIAASGPPSARVPQTRSFRPKLAMDRAPAAARPDPTRALHGPAARGAARAGQAAGRSRPPRSGCGCRVA